MLKLKLVKVKLHGGRVSLKLSGLLFKAKVAKKRSLGQAFFGAILVMKLEQAYKAGKLSASF